MREKRENAAYYLQLQPYQYYVIEKTVQCQFKKSLRKETFYPQLKQHKNGAKPSFSICGWDKIFATHCRDDSGWIWRLSFLVGRRRWRFREILANSFESQRGVQRLEGICRQKHLALENLKLRNVPRMLTNTFYLLPVNFYFIF